MKKHVLILGAGKSSTALIDYLANETTALNIELTVADIQLETALAKTANRPYTTAISLDVTNEKSLFSLIEKSFLVISMLPAFMHPKIASFCLLAKKHLLTPSYITDELKNMDAKVKEAGLIFLNEMGLDPGIDHMSAMALLNELRDKGAHITGFLSHCGGLVAPASDTNTWHYKFSWNPRNVILAGQGNGFIQYLKDGRKKELSYSELFSEITEYNIPGYGILESYPNRDSLKYQQVYKLAEVQNLYRGTFRKSPYCKAWNLLVKLGYTENKELLKFDHTFTNADVLTELYLNKTSNYPGHHLKETICKYLNIQDQPQLIQMLEEIDLFDAEKEFEKGFLIPCVHLQRILEEKWKLQPGDSDWVVMLHEVRYTLNGENRKRISYFSMEGIDEVQTAMSATVGLPLAIASKMIIEEKITETGVLMPVSKEWYEPVLNELKHFGIVFEENDLPI